MEEKKKHKAAEGTNQPDSSTASANAPPEQKKRGRGRPRKEFHESYITLARELMSAGFTRERLALELGIGDDLLKEWEQRFPDFAGAIRAGAIIADSAMEMSTYKRGQGYEMTEVHVEEVMDEANQTVRKVKREITRHVPGDPRCQMFWLRNRRPDKWRESSEAGQTVGLFVANMTPDQKATRERIAAMKKEQAE